MEDISQFLAMLLAILIASVITGIPAGLISMLKHRGFAWGFACGFFLTAVGLWQVGLLIPLMRPGSPKPARVAQPGYKSDP
jgi:hypothetical protein